MILNYQFAHVLNKWNKNNRSYDKITIDLIFSEESKKLIPCLLNADGMTSEGTNCKLKDFIENNNLQVNIYCRNIPKNFDNLSLPIFEYKMIGEPVIEFRESRFEPREKTIGFFFKNPLPFISNSDLESIIINQRSESRFEIKYSLAPYMYSEFDKEKNQIVVKNRQIPIQNKNRLAKKYNCRILRSVDCKDLQGQDETFSLLLAKELKKEEILLIKDSTFAFGSPEILKDYYLLSSGWEQKTANEFISKFLIDLEKAEEQFEDTKNLTPLNKRLKLLASNYKEILESVKYQTTDDDLKPLYSKMMEISKCKENYQAFITHILRTPTIYEEKKEK